MQVFYCYCLFRLLVSLTTPAYAQSPAESIRVLSYNIRYDNPDEGEDRWINRKERLTGLIRYHAPDLIGTQEALYNQVKDVADALPQYAWYGVGRDDGKEAGEFSAIFYNKSKFQLVDKGTFWLSPEPDKPTKGWDAAIVRVCSWVKLKRQSTGKEVFFFNTHFDHKGQQARERSAALIREKIKEIAGNAPVILSGDFNTNDASPPYQTLTKDQQLQDAKTVSDTGHYGPDGSFSGFDISNPLGERIDFIFVSQKFAVLKHAILTDSQNGKYPSDHLPVLSEIQLR